MDQVIYVLAIMGCSDDNLACQQARVEPVRYASYAACQEAVPAALGRNTDVDYPVIAAACQRQGARMVEAQPKRSAGR
ncbi:hypothetical protein [Sphingomonas sp.]|jgi:hypothetical protein|uniref:hypothetical protein n=1 Tax=Sphingomonas sp. TaxID=28214 RepID=UPI002EDB29C2